MYKINIEKICEYCGKVFMTKQAKAKACSQRCAKILWKKKVKILGHNITSSAGRKKGSIPWNKNKICPQLTGKNNGFFNHHHSEETKEKIRNSSNITKRKNNTFNTSEKEDTVYEKLLTKFKIVKRQYKSPQYPFNCDFYLVEENLYIECNFHWTHGIFNHKIYAPYDSNKLEHQKLLSYWQNKNTKYFNNAIKTWTQRDVKKRMLAKENNLNWLEFFTLDEFIKWFNQQ